MEEFGFSHFLIGFSHKFRCIILHYPFLFFFGLGGQCYFFVSCFKCYFLILGSIRQRRKRETLTADETETMLMSHVVLAARKKVEWARIGAFVSERIPTSNRPTEVLRRRYTNLNKKPEAIGHIAALAKNYRALLAEGFDVEFDLGQEVDLLKAMAANPAQRGNGTVVANANTTLPMSLTEFEDEYDLEDGGLEDGGGGGGGNIQILRDVEPEDLGSDEVKLSQMQEAIKATLWLEAEFSNAEFGQAFKRLSAAYSDGELQNAFDKLRSQGVVTKAKSRPGQWHR